MSVKIQSGLNEYSNLSGLSASREYSASKNISYEKNNEDSGNGLRILEHEQYMQEKKKSVVNQSISYAEQLKASRRASKKTSLEKKKLQYNFKKVSSQIVRSKNSVSARKAVQAAKREIMRLKRLKGNGEFDEEELQLAIDHAEAMEKVAKKKAIHLEQEEMVERAHKGFGAALEEIEEKNQDKNNEDEAENEDEISEEELQSLGNSTEDEWLNVDEEYLPEYDYQYELQLSMEEYQQQMQEMSQEIADSTELTESLYAPDPNMSEEDLKMLKIKHRAKEMKEIAEADKEYLKGMIEHEKSKAQQLGNTAMSGPQMTSSQAVLGSAQSQKITPMISMPGAAAGAMSVAPTLESGSFCVSV